MFVSAKVTGHNEGTTNRTVTKHISPILEEGKNRVRKIISPHKIKKKERGK